MVAEKEKAAEEGGVGKGESVEDDSSREEAGAKKVARMQQRRG